MASSLTPAGVCSELAILCMSLYTYIQTYINATHTHTHTHSLSLSLSHTHTHTNAENTSGAVLYMDLTDLAHTKKNKTENTSVAVLHMDLTDLASIESFDMRVAALVNGRCVYVCMCVCVCVCV